MNILSANSALKENHDQNGQPTTKAKSQLKSICRDVPDIRSVSGIYAGYLTIRYYPHPVK